MAVEYVYYENGVKITKYVTIEQPIAINVNSCSKITNTYIYKKNVNSSVPRSFVNIVDLDKRIKYLLDNCRVKPGQKKALNKHFNKANNLYGLHQRIANKLIRICNTIEEFNKKYGNDVKL